jgi:hypothetical protein
LRDRFKAIHTDRTGDKHHPKAERHLQSPAEADAPERQPRLPDREALREDLLLDGARESNNALSTAPYTARGGVAGGRCDGRRRRRGEGAVVVAVGGRAGAGEGGGGGELGGWVPGLLHRPGPRNFARSRGVVVCAVDLLGGLEKSRRFWGRIWKVAPWQCAYHASIMLDNGILPDHSLVAGLEPPQRMPNSDVKLYIWLLASAPCEILNRFCLD